MLLSVDRENKVVQDSEEYLPIQIPSKLIPNLKTSLFFKKKDDEVNNSYGFSIPSNLYVKKKDYLSLLKEIGELASGEDNDEVKMSTYTSCFKYQLLSVISNPNDNKAFRETINLTIKNLEVYNNAKVQGIDKYIEKLSNQKDLLTLVMFRTMITVMMAKKLGWTGVNSISPLVQSSLFCDSNLLNFNPDHHLLQENLKIEDNAKCQELHNHIKGLEKTIHDFKIKSNNVISTIQQHHENNDGTGPLKKKGLEIYPLAKILRLADFFACRVLSKNDPLTVEDALKLVRNKKHVFDSKFTQVLIDCF